MFIISWRTTGAVNVPCCTSTNTVRLQNTRTGFIFRTALTGNLLRVAPISGVTFGFHPTVQSHPLPCLLSEKSKSPLPLPSFLPRFLQKKNLRRALDCMRGTREAILVTLLFKLNSAIPTKSRPTPQRGPRSPHPDYSVPPNVYYITLNDK